MKKITILALTSLITFVPQYAFSEKIEYSYGKILGKNHQQTGTTLSRPELLETFTLTFPGSGFEFRNFYFGYHQGLYLQNSECEKK